MADAGGTGLIASEPHKIVSRPKFVKQKDTRLPMLLNEAPESGDAIIWRDQAYTYGELGDRISSWEAAIDSHKIPPGAVTTLEGDFSPNTIALFMALAHRGNIVVPINPTTARQPKTMYGIAQAQWAIRVAADDQVRFHRLEGVASHEFYETLHERKHPGLVLFTSGTSGEPKAAVHDLAVLFESFGSGGKQLRTLNFLLFDHWGGLNTMLHTLSNGGTVVQVSDRSPEQVCQTIERHKAELLPTSPTFLNLLILNEAHKRYDLSSLQIISYGTEPMPESTLRLMSRLFPDVKLKQTYGLIEVGVLASKSKDRETTWVKVGGEGYETKIVDGILQIRAKTAMLGYLNAPSPFTEDGWFDTGDSVEVENGYMRILGRKSEIINVGGEKVYPAEVESVIQEFENVAEVTVHGERNTLTGQIVCATVRLREEEDPKVFSRRLKKFCREQLETFKVPVKVEITHGAQHGDRFKKRRISV